MAKSMMDRVLQGVDGSKTIQLAQQMAKIPSFGGKEQEMAKFLAGVMKKIGMDVEMREVEPNRPQPVGRLRGTGEGPSLLFNGHMDHNPVVEGWEIDPFGGIIKDGYLYGPGVVNMKGGVCAMISAVDAIQRAKIKPKGDIVVTPVVGELQCGLGTHHNVDHGIITDYAVVTEPTGLKIYTFHAGVYELLINVIGATRHFSTVAKKGVGIHAIKKMIKIIDALGPFMEPIKHGGWLTGWKVDPRFDGLPQVNVGTIEAGLSRDMHKWRGGSIMPDFCQAAFDVRFLPGMTPESMERDLKKLIDKIVAEDPQGFKYEIKRNPTFPYVMPVYDESAEARIVKTVAKYQKQVAGEAEIDPSVWKSSIWVQFYGSDAAILREAGIETALYGPGGGELTTPKERVKVEDIVTATKVLALTAVDIAGASD